MPHPLDILPVATDAKLDCYGENGKAVEKNSGRVRQEQSHDTTRGAILQCAQNPT